MSCSLLDPQCLILCPACRNHSWVVEWVNWSYLCCTLQLCGQRKQKPRELSWNPEFQACRGRASEAKLCLGRCYYWPLTYSGDIYNPLLLSHCRWLLCFPSYLNPAQLKKHGSSSIIWSCAHSSSTQIHFISWDCPLLDGKHETWGTKLGFASHSSVTLWMNVSKPFIFSGLTCFHKHWSLWDLKDMAGKSAQTKYLTHHRYSIVSVYSFFIVFPLLVKGTKFV